MRVLVTLAMAGGLALTGSLPLVGQDWRAAAEPGRAPALVTVETERLAHDAPMPLFKADAAWPQLPADTILGQVPGLSVDAEDTVWIIQRPESLDRNEAGLLGNPPTTLSCCRPAPHVIRFAADGRILAAWGGPELAPVRDGQVQWPNSVHGIFAADDGTIWIAGNGTGDHVVLNFTKDGRYLRQFGERGQTGGNASTGQLGNPADIFADASRVLIADGYINKRIVELDARDLSFEKAWGAYGAVPGSAVRQEAFDQSQAASNADGGADPHAREFGDIVHCVERGPDSLIYVCDRRNNRIQVFREAAGQLEFLRDILIAPRTGGLRTASDVAFSPDGTYLYVADMANDKIWVLLRETDQVIGSIGRVGRYPGQFFWLHSVATDSQGNLYTTEVGTGRRVQKLVLSGWLK